MKIVYEYSHLGGGEILKVKFPQIEQEVLKVIRAVKPTKTKISKEKTMRGKKLFAPVDMNEQFKNNFNALGYNEIRDI